MVLWRPTRPSFLYSLYWSLRKAFLSLLAILWNSVFKWVYLSFSPLPFTSLLFQRRRRHSTPVLLPGKSRGWRSLVGWSPWGHEESDTIEQLHFHFSLSCIGEGNGNQLLVRPSQITILPFCISFSWGWSWSLTAFCTISWTSVHSSSGTLSIRSNPSNVSHFHCITVRDLM